MCRRTNKFRHSEWSPLLRSYANRVLKALCRLKLVPVPKDIEVEIYYLTHLEGGRATPAFTGYRPQFYYNDQDWDASHIYPDEEKANPGETVRAFLAATPTIQCSLASNAKALSVVLL